RWDKEHHPGGVHKEASRLFLGDAATPPRGDARRGIRSFQNETQNHISLSRPRSTRLSTTSAILTWTDVPREEGWLRHQEDVGQAYLSAADWVVARTEYYL